MQCYRECPFPLSSHTQFMFLLFRSLHTGHLLSDSLKLYHLLLTYERFLSSHKDNDVFCSGRWPTMGIKNKKSIANPREEPAGLRPHSIQWQQSTFHLVSAINPGFVHIQVIYQSAGWWTSPNLHILWARRHYLLFIKLVWIEFPSKWRRRSDW